MRSLLRESFSAPSSIQGEAEEEEQAKHEPIAYKMKLLIDLVRVTDFVALFMDASSLRTATFARDLCKRLEACRGFNIVHARVNVHHLCRQFSKPVDDLKTIILRNGAELDIDSRSRFSNDMLRLCSMTKAS